MQLQKIPTTILTGFLGSGKTSLLRHLLTANTGLRIAVIVNEFGELGIDGELLKGCGLGCDEASGQQNLYELANGCVCCTVQEEFLPVMQALIERREQLDHIIIETSGLALPKPLVQAFNWPEIRSACSVDAVITLVDTPAVAAGQFAAQPELVQAAREADPNLDHLTPLQELFSDQLLAADVVVLSKTDLVSAELVQQVQQQVQDCLPAAVKILRSERGRLAPELLLGLHQQTETLIDARQTHHDFELEHDHDEFDSLSIELTVSDLKPLLSELQQLVQDYAIYRIKGFIALPGKPMRMVLQGVGQRFEHYFDRPWHVHETPRSTLVLIGEDLPAAVIQDRLQHGLTETC